METLLGKDHVDYKRYIEQFNIVIDAIDEIAFLSNTLDYERLVVFFKEIVETFEFFKNIDENDDNSEGFSNMNNKDDLFLSIIDCDEYNNLIKFMTTYRETIIRKSNNLREKKIQDLLAFKSLINTEDKPNKYIEEVYDRNIKLIMSKMEDIKNKLENNIEKGLPVIDLNKVKFDIKLITKNDMICILSSYRFLKRFVYKHMHVIDREYYTATKEDVLEFRKELYDIYTMLREHFNREKNLYVEDILAKFLEVIETLREGAKDSDTKGEPEKTEEPKEPKVVNNKANTTTEDNNLDEKYEELYKKEKENYDNSAPPPPPHTASPPPPPHTASPPPPPPPATLGFDSFISANPKALTGEFRGKADALSEELRGKADTFSGNFTKSLNFFDEIKNTATPEGMAALALGQGKGKLSLPITTDKADLGRRIIRI